MLVSLCPSMISARHSPQADSSMITANGKAVAMVMVCRALSPPAINSTAAITPSVEAQNTRCQTGVSVRPPADSESITSEPESEDVTKKVMINITVMNETTSVSGRRSYSLNRAMAVFDWTSPIKAV